MRANYVFKPSYQRFEIIRRTRFPGQSRHEFCLTYGFASTALSKWKADQYTPSIDRIYKFCEIFGCRFEDFFEGMKPLVRQYDFPGIGENELTKHTVSPDTAAFISYYERLDPDEKLQIISEVINKINAKT